MGKLLPSRLWDSPPTPQVPMAAVADAFVPVRFWLQVMGIEADTKRESVRGLVPLTFSSCFFVVFPVEVRRNGTTYHKRWYSLVKLWAFSFKYGQLAFSWFAICVQSHIICDCGKFTIISIFSILKSAGSRRRQAQGTIGTKRNESSIMLPAIILIAFGRDSPCELGDEHRNSMVLLQITGSVRKRWNNQTWRRR